MNRYFIALCFVIAIVSIYSCKGVKGQNNTKDEYSSIWDYFSKENSKPFTLIHDSLISYNEKDKITEFIIDVENRKINVSFEKSKIDPVIDLNIQILNMVVNIDSFLFVANKPEYVKEDLLTRRLVSNGFTGQVYYNNDNNKEFLLFRAGHKGAVGTWAIRQYWILLSFNDISSKIYVIYDLTGMLRGNSFGDFNNDNVLDFIFLEGIDTYVNQNDYPIAWLYKVNRINIDKNLIKDSIFTFKSDRYGQEFEMIK